MFIVYKITNIINNKIYFGYTKQRLNQRFYGHYNEPRNTIISHSIRKYGPKNFSKEIIIECENENDAKFIETFLIYRYKTNILKFPEGNGMNMTDGGEGARGYKHTEELREKWSRERKGKPCKHNYTEETDPKNKRVYQFTPTGDFVDYYPSAKLAGRKLKIHPSNITKCCQGKAKTCGGYIFQYTEIYKTRQVLPNYNKMYGEKNPRSKKCFLYDKTEHCYTIYSSLGEIARKTNLNYSNIKKSAQTNKWIYLGRFLISYQPQREYEHWEHRMHPSV